MNVERLHRVLKDIEKDIKISKTQSLLQNIQSHLQNQVNQPNQPSHQTNLVSELKNLYKLLSNSESNYFSPSWNQIVEELGGSDLLGYSLKEKLEQIFASNQITPAKALEEVNTLVKEFQTFNEAVNQTLSAFKKLSIGEENLEPGECELGYVIPREFVENKLASLKNEIVELNFILNTISEAVTGSKEEYEVRTISSSDFLLYILIGINVANVLSKVTERILNHYKQILEIKNLRNQLIEQGIPKSKTKEIETHANNLMETEIKKIAKEILSENYKGDKGRKNELENGLIISLNKLANRIDNGFNVEIRVQPLPQHEHEENSEENEEITKQNEMIKSIQESAKNIEFLETKGQSILRLPENNK